MRWFGLIVVSSSKGLQVLIFGRLFVVNFEKPGQLRAAIAAAGLAINPHAIAELETADDFGRDENILRCLDEVAFRVAQETRNLCRKSR